MFNLRVSRCLSSYQLSHKLWNTLFPASKNFGHQSSKTKTFRHGNEASGNAGQDCHVSSKKHFQWAMGSSETIRNPDSDVNHFVFADMLKQRKLESCTKAVFNSSLVFAVLKHQVPPTACTIICNHLGSLTSM